MGWLYGVPAANCSLMSWRSRIHICTCRKNHLWPGLVHTQRSGLSPKAIGPLLKIYANIDYFMLAHDCFYNFFTRSYYEAVYEI